MTTQEIASRLVSLCSAGQFASAIRELYSDDILSMEAAPGPTGSREAKGLAEVLKKTEWWEQNNEVHGSSVEGPLVAGSHFSVKFTLDVTFKPAGQRFTMEEIAVYEVKDGKIVREEFFYSM